MGLFTKRDQKTLELTAEAQAEKQKRVDECRKEIADVLKKYNCGLTIGQQIIINPN